MKTIKKIMMLFILVTLTITISACGKKLIAGPTNLDFDKTKGIVSWDEVKSARYYLLNINGNTVEVFENEYSLLNLPNGNYDLKIKAVFKKGESIYSNTLRVILSKERNINLFSDGTKVFWDEIEGAQYFIEYVDNLEIKQIEVEENEFLIPKTLKNEQALIKLTVYLNSYLVSIEEITIYFKEITVYQENEYTINVKGAKELYINNILIETGYKVTKTKLILSKQLINSYDDYINISIIGEENIYLKAKIDVELFELISLNKQPYVNDDVYFEFDLKGFTIKQIVNLREDDYELVNNTLIIKKDFIESYITSNPNKQTIYLTVIFTKGYYEKDWPLEIDIDI